MSYVNGLKPDNETYLCGESYWTGVEHDILGCNFKNWKAWNNGDVLKIINYVTDNNTLKLIIQPMNFQILLTVLKTHWNRRVNIPTQSVTVPPLAVVLQEVQESGISQLGITQYLEIKI